MAVVNLRKPVQSNSPSQTTACSRLRRHLQLKYLCRTLPLRSSQVCSSALEQRGKLAHQLVDLQVLRCRRPRALATPKYQYYQKSKESEFQLDFIITGGRHFPGPKNSIKGLASASVWAGGDGFEVHTRASRRLSIQGLLDNSGYQGGSKFWLLYMATRNRDAGFAMVCSSMGDIEEKRSGSGKRPLQSCHGLLAHAWSRNWLDHMRTGVGRPVWIPKNVQGIRYQAYRGMWDAACLNAS